MNPGKVLLALMLLLVTTPCANLALAASGWSGPSAVASGGWFAWPTVSDDGTRIVFLAPYSSADKYKKQIEVVDFANGSWGTPIVVAFNGIDYSGEPFVWLPTTCFTHPVISGNGRLIAYLGSTPTGDQYNPYKSEIYVIEKTETGWSAPSVLPTGFALHEHFMSVSYDATAIAFVYANGNIFGGPPWRVYVSRRTEGVWGTPVVLSEDDKGAPSRPSMSADGTKVVWIQNSSLVCAEFDGTRWSTPQWLVNVAYTDTGHEDVTNPRISADGTAITYWLLKVEQSTMVGQDLYVIRRTTEGWSTPVKVTVAAVVPTSSYDAPAALNGNATRVIYPRNVKYEDSIVASYLEMTELRDGAWTTPTGLTSPAGVYDSFPVLTPDGKLLIYNAGGEIRSLRETGSASQNFNLTVTRAGTGQGTVTATGLTCGSSSCSGTYSANSFVILTAVAEGASLFAGWTGACSGDSPTCAVMVDQAKSVTATFNLPGLTLSPGWNFISFPKLPLSHDIPAVLSGVLSGVASVWGWDGQNQAWQRYVPGQTGSLTIFEPNKGYWIYMTNLASIDTTGWVDVASHTVQLFPGWNLIGYNGADNALVSHVTNTIAGRWSMIWGWSNGQWSAKHETISTVPPLILPLSVFNQGRAYWIRVKQGMGTSWQQ